MSALPVPQRAFSAALLSMQAVAPAGLRVPAGVDAQRRFAVHRNNVTVALIDALAAAFPVVHELVGDAFFRDLARDYARIDPPRSPVMSDYGDGFAAFIDAYAPVANLPYLGDMARLERLRGQSYHAADADALPVEAFRALLASPQRLAVARVRLHPASRWLASQHAVHSLWAAHRHADVGRDAAFAAIDTERGEHVLVFRPRHEVQLAALPDGAVVFLDALHAQATFGDALAQACDDTAAARLDMLFALVLQHGLVVQIGSLEEH